MTAQRESSSRPSALRRFFRFLLRFMFILIIGGLIGVGLYYGVPWAYRNLVWPVQDNRARVAILEQRLDLEQGHLQERDRALQDRIFELETAVADMETELTELGEQATVQVLDQHALEAQNAQFDDRIAQLNSDLEAQRQEVEAAAQQMEATAQQIESSLGDATADLDKQLEDLQERLGDVTANLAQQVEENQGALDDAYAQLGNLQGRLALLQTAQDLVKVRLLLIEENTGTARDTLDLAIAHLERASTLMPLQAETLEDLRNRMTALDDLIAGGSFRTRPDLEALWADVMDLVVPVMAQSTVTTTQATSPVPTPTPSP